MAGVPGFEPDLQVLETYVLATDTTPLRRQVILGLLIRRQNKIFPSNLITPVSCLLSITHAADKLLGLIDWFVLEGA